MDLGRKRALLLTVDKEQSLVERRAEYSGTYLLHTHQAPVDYFKPMDADSMCQTQWDTKIVNMGKRFVWKKRLWQGMRG